MHFAQVQIPPRLRHQGVSLGPSSPPTVAARPRCHAMGHLALAVTGGGWLLILPHSPMRTLLPLAGHEEVLQDGHWVGLLLVVIVLTSTLAACLAPPVT